MKKASLFQVIGTVVLILSLCQTVAGQIHHNTLSQYMKRSMIEGANPYGDIEGEPYYPGPEFKSESLSK